MSAGIATGIVNAPLTPEANPVAPTNLTWVANQSGYSPPYVAVLLEVFVRYRLGIGKGPKIIYAH
jgi:hypothetical protein